MHHFIEFVINHWVLWSLLGFLFVAIVYVEITTSVGGVPQVSPQQVTHLINRDHATVIDVRSEQEYQQGHITGALNFPSDHLKSDSKKLDKYKNKPLILICQNGANSTQLAHQLRGAFSQVVTLKGGIDGWAAARMPLIKPKQS